MIPSAEEIGDGDRAMMGGRGGTRATCSSSFASMIAFRRIIFCAGSMCL